MAKYDCKCSNCTNKVSTYNSYCSTCSSYSKCSSSGSCTRHCTTTHYCKCNACSTAVSCNTSQCSKCDSYAECKGCYNCGYHYTICSDCGYCTVCGCKCSSGGSGGSSGGGGGSTTSCTGSFVVTSDTHVACPECGMYSSNSNVHQITETCNRCGASTTYYGGMCTCSKFKTTAPIRAHNN